MIGGKPDCLFSVHWTEVASIPAIPAIICVNRRILDLGQVFYGIDYDPRVAPASREIPRVDPLQLRQTYRRLHLGHAVVPSDHVVYVGQLLLQLQQAQSLFDIIAVIAETSRLPFELYPPAFGW